MKVDLNTDFKKQIERKELELSALLEITQAINSNLPEESLYKIFNFTLRSNLHIRKLALFVFDKIWSCKVSFGTQKDYQKSKLDERVKMIRNIHRMSEFENCEFDEFDLVIPVAHKSDTLALVFVGGIEHSPSENEEDLRFI